MHLKKTLKYFSWFVCPKKQPETTSVLAGNSRHQMEMRPNKKHQN
jgi:hypothetical protein